MKFSLLVHSSQTASHRHNQLGCSNLMVLEQLAKIMSDLSIQGQILNLPIHARARDQASPFSIQSGFALNPLDLDLFGIPEIQGQQRLLQELTKLQTYYTAQYADGPALSYPLRGSMVEWALSQAFEHFNPAGKRKKSYEEFLREAAFWLTDYANHEVESGGIKLTPLESEREIAYLTYQQFLCWEQGKRLHEALQARSIGLVLNLPFGLDLTSADVVAYRAVFKSSLQVGCGPEPYNGFPEQAWGIAPYQEKTKALQEYLIQRLEWLSLFGDGLFLDHMVGWCGQYVLPQTLPEGEGPHGEFLTTDPEQREANLKWFLKILQKSKMEIMGELAGDLERVQVSKRVLGQAHQQGRDVKVMAIPRWEKTESGEYLPLKDYPANSLLMVETHDTSTLLQYLTNRKGRGTDFEKVSFIFDFSRQVLALPVFFDQMPWAIESLSEDAVWEIFRRFYHGSPADELVFTLPGLLTWLHPKYRSTEVTSNINIQPGTSGVVGNPTGNWSFFSPPVEALSELAERFQQLGPRQFLPFDPVQVISTQVQGLEACWAKLENKVPLGLKEGKWVAFEKGAATHELVLYNANPYPLQGLLTLPEWGLKGEKVRITDQLQEEACWEHDWENLTVRGLFYDMAPGQKHHLLFRVF